MRFEHELSQIRVVYSSGVGGTDEIQLCTVLEAMDVSVTRKNTILRLLC